MLFKYGIAVHVCILRPESRGTIQLKSNNPDDDAEIIYNLLDTEKDLNTMISGLKIARKIFNQPPLSENAGEEILPGKNYQSKKEIEQYLREKTNTIYHPVGTCKMGKDNLSVVDSELKTHGIDCLRVVDASIMPTLISGNTNAPTVMIAAKAADMILKAHSSTN